MGGKDGDRGRGGTVWCPPASHLSPWKRGLSLSPPYKSNETIWAFSLLKFLRPNLQCDWSPVTDRTNNRPTVTSFFFFFGLVVANGCSLYLLFFCWNKSQLLWREKKMATLQMSKTCLWVANILVGQCRQDWNYKRFSRVIVFFHWRLFSCCFWLLTIVVTTPGWSLPSFPPEIWIPEHSLFEIPKT